MRTYSLFTTARILFETVLERGREQGLYEDAALWIRRGEQELELKVGMHPWFDLASLTKPLVAGSLTLLLLARGVLRLDDPLTRWIPREELEGITLEMLLRHEAGLIPFAPWYQAFPPEPQEFSRVLPHLLKGAVLHPPGTQTLYSDCGFLLLGYCLEQVLGKPLWEAFASEITTPLKIAELSYFPPRVEASPTGYCSWRKRHLKGEPHDPNAHLLLGSAAHAGLFGTARGVGQLATALVKGWHQGFLDAEPAWVQRFLSIPPEPERRPLAWDRVTPGKSQAGNLAPPRALGHLGFTGTSLWIVPEEETIVVLLTNRVHCDMQGERFRSFRPRFHDLIWGYPF